jgi:hypothetical protein
MPPAGVEKMRGGGLKTAGFSLLDCLIALALIGVVISMAIPLTMQYLNRTHTAACLTQIAEIEKIFPRFAKENPTTPLISLMQLASPKYLGRPPECPHGGTYALIQPEQTGENIARVVCSLHFWPARAKTAVVDAALAGGWDMNEGKGPAIGGGVNQGTIHGAQWVTGRSGTALKFSTHEAEAGALGDFVKVKHHPALNLAGQGTLEAWIRMDRINPYGGIIHKGNNKNFSDESYSLQLWHDGTIVLGLAPRHPGGQPLILHSRTRLKPDQWYYVVGTWEPAGMKVYINGAPDSAAAVAAVAKSTAGDVQIGAQLDQALSPEYKNLAFSGMIDDVAIYSRALTAQEILNTYKQMK